MPRTSENGMNYAATLREYKPGTIINFGPDTPSRRTLAFVGAAQVGASVATRAVNGTLHVQIVKAAAPQKAPKLYPVSKLRSLPARGGGRPVGSGLVASAKKSAKAKGKAASKVAKSKAKAPRKVIVTNMKFGAKSKAKRK